MLTAARLDQLLAAFPKATIGVIGDFCLDVYWFIDMQKSEVSIETGKPTHPVRDQRYSLGGAGNVVANLRALGAGTVRAFGAIGDDPFGQRLLNLLAACGADGSGVVMAGAADPWQTLAYCKPYIGEEELSRLDMGNFNRLPARLAKRLLANLERAMPGLDVVIVNEQVATGIHVPVLRQQLRALMQRYPEKTFLFDGRHCLDSYPEACMKLNAYEVSRLGGVHKGLDEVVLREEVVAAAENLFARTSRPVFVTRSERGCMVMSKDGLEQIPGLLITAKVDPVGAGDSFLSGVAAALAAGGTPTEAAQIGNFVAGVTVTKLRQTGTASPAEVHAVGAVPDYVYEPELADNPRWARHWEQTEIEVVAPLPDALHVRYAIFDHDGTISTLRQGWEEVMEPVMLRAILGERYTHADEALFRKVTDRVRRFIDQTTGIQTLVQMQGLVAMVREFGFVPPDKIQDEFGYKKIYNDALMELVCLRLRKLADGELAVDDFCVKNAVLLLKRLHAAGIKLYLASGTDEADVIREAEAMGYAHLFEGRIYGAVGDVTKEAKKMVLDRILTEIGQTAGQIATFGDGPVEMRETRRRGGFAVGLASDEVRRFGLNPAKRARLIRAGASVVLPDFSQLPALLRLLQVPPAD